ncbi:MAG: tetratricopeptide repeat protein [Nitrospiraceae bacterium]|nr:MAG: tetratricopeptide repeat protein [Nitrospiraceae bacterium]
MNIDKNRSSEHAVFFLCIVYGFLLALRQIENFDIWWHLKSGEMIVNTFHIPQKEMFSHTIPGALRVPHEWLSQVLFYISFKTGGLAGLGIFAAVIISLTAAITWMRGRRMGSNMWVLAGILMWVLLIARLRFMTRPHIFLFLLAGVLLFLLEQYDRKGKRIFAWLTIPCMAIWANLHGSFPLGFIFLFFWSIASVLRTRSLFPLVIFIIAAVATTINPSGLQLHVSVVKDLFIKATVNPTVNNEEFMSPSFMGYKLFWSFLCFSFIIIITSARKVRISILEAVTFASTVVLSVKGIYYIPVFVFLASPYTAYRVSVLLDTLLNKLKHSGFSFLGSRTLAGSMLVIAMFIGFADAYGPYKTYRWGIGLDERSIPEKAAEFLDATDLKDIKLYNNLRFGGYLAWRLYPRFRISMDGRGVFLPFIETLAIQEWNDYVTLMKRYNFDVAVTSFNPETTFESFLRNDPAWSLVYWNDRSLIYAKRGNVPEAFIDEWEYKYVSPFSLDYTYLKKPVSEGKGAAVIDELNRAISDNQQSFKPWVYIGYVKELMGDISGSIDAYEKALAINPEIGVFHYNIADQLGRLYLVSKKPEQASMAFEQHFSAHPEEGMSLYYYALALYQLKEYEKSKINFKKYLDEQPDNPNALTDFGFLLIDMRSLNEAEQYFKKALTISEKGTAMYGLALTYQKMGSCDKSIPLWQQIITLKMLPEKWIDASIRFKEACEKETIK